MVNKDIKEFVSGERLRAARLDELRVLLLSLVKDYEMRFGPLSGEADKPAMDMAVVKVGDQVEDRTGVYGGSTYTPPIVTPTAGDLAEANLGQKLETADGTQVNDAEVWDLAALGLRLGHLFGRNADGKPVLVVDGGGRAVLVKVTGNSSRNGEYTGRILTGGADDSGVGNMAAADFGALPDSDNCLIRNAAEEGKASHDLTAATVVCTKFVGVIIGATAAGLPIVAISGYDWKACS